jgi:uncharacterized membrane protein
MEEQTTQQPVQPAAPQNNQTDVEKNKVFAILAYFIFFIPLLAAKDSKFAMYHANQGLILFLFAIIGWLVSIVTAFIFIGFLIGFIVWIAAIVFLIIGIVNAAKGEMKPLPLIGAINILQ